MWLVWQSLVWFANHWLQLVGLAAIVFVIRILLAMNEKLAQIIAHTGLNDWRLRNEVDAIKGVFHIYTLQTVVLARILIHEFGKLGTRSQRLKNYSKAAFLCTEKMNTSDGSESN
jgi:hypothetical protein